ncbi:DUF4255 domain-containing protein [Almyronema epifaneia]|uniref:DUF4255 domain-containing protein n=1 Tax=Almyronema epifaneia S1 TaxID=2991925 RepID=A0ABW6IE71_9CYAN
MSNYLAIATVTATLQRTLQAAVQLDVEGARVTTVRPSDIGNGTPETGVNIFLYQIITNPALNNIDATPFRSRGNPVKRQAALDLYYMLSFYGNDTELAPQRLLGSVVSTLNDYRMIPAEIIRDACEDSTLSFLQDSRLADQIQQITVMPLDLNLEDLSKSWTVFFQTPYVLSIAYKVMVVLIEGDRTARRALPVRDRRTGSLAPYFNQPAVEQVLAASGRYDPILLDSNLILRGKNLKGDEATQVRVCGVNVTPTQVTATEIQLALADVPMAAIRAGVQSLQVFHPPATTRGQSPRRGVESNAAPFVLRPVVTQVEVEVVEDPIDEPRSGRLWIEVNLTVGAEQRVVVFLNEWSTEAPRDYSFEADPRTTESQAIAIPFKEVEAGDYLVRLQIDGAESQLEIDNTPGSPTENWFIGPRITIR